MQRFDAAQAIEDHAGLVPVVLRYLEDIPHVIEEMHRRMDIELLCKRLADSQVPSLNSFFFRYLAKFDGTLHARQCLSAASSAVDWLIDFVQEVLPVLRGL